MLSKYDEIFESRVEVDPEMSFDKISIITPSCKGVILFTDSEGNPVQLLTAADMRRTIRARLFRDDESEDKSRRADLSEVVRNIYYLRCWCDFETGWKHYLAAREIFAKDYKEHINSYKSSYISIDIDKQWPGFGVSDSPVGVDTVFGPFASGSDCRFYIEVLTEAFGLCKNQACLGNEEKAKSCPYLQMGLCDGVCVGRISRNEYIDRVKAAVDAVGKHEVITGRLKEKMLALSGDMRFEQAGSIKSMLEKFIKKEDIYRWVCGVKDFSVVHVDKYEKIKISGQKKKVQSFAGFLIKAGHIYKLANFTADDAGTFLETLKTIKPLGGEVLSKRQVKEQFDITAYYLYRSNRKGLWSDYRKDSEVLDERLKEFMCGQ